MDVKSETSGSKKDAKPTTSLQEEKMTFKCNNCDASFSQKRKLNRHIGFLVCINRQAVSCRKEALPIKKKPFKCNKGKNYYKCNDFNASFSQKGDLNRHVISVHEGKKPFKCNVCDACFSHKGKLNKHIKSFHERKKKL